MRLAVFGHDLRGGLNKKPKPKKSYKAGKRVVETAARRIETR